MSLWVAVPCGIGSAILYGASTAVQHDAAHSEAGGKADARGLLKLIRDPRWLMSIGGDSLGLVLQVIALATGPVVLIQPLLVLSIPVSLPIGWMLGGPRPRRGDYLACLAILAGLAVFFGLLGSPGDGDRLSTTTTVWLVAISVVAAALLCLAVWGRSAPIRAGVFGGVAGALFGVVGVLLNAVAEAGFDGLVHTDGLVPLVGLIIVGGIGMTLTQVSFQIGSLGASFPANESTAPVVAVILGAALLHENLPLNVGYVIVYVLCLAAIVLGTVRLANPPRAAQ